MIRKIQIIDFTDPNTSIYNSRSETLLYRMFEPEPGLFIAETELVIRRALNAGYVPVSMLIVKDELVNLSGLIDECSDSFEKQKKSVLNASAGSKETANETAVSDDAFPVYYAEYEILKNLTGFPLTRGVCCAMKRRALSSIDDVLSSTQTIAILCDIENPTNIGTIFRNAAALNVDSVILYGNCSDPLYRRSLRAGMGCQFSVPWTFCDNLSLIRDAGFTFAALALSDNSCSLSEFSSKAISKKAILLGNEGYGLNKDILDLCDFVVKIPMREGVDSLNVAVTSGIAFYELNK